MVRQRERRLFPKALELSVALIGVNVVILARNYNPSIVSRDWLYQKGIIVDATPNFIHTPVFSLVESDELALAVDENRLQIAVKKPDTESPERVAQLATKFVDLLPETPYSAVGFNYEYAVAKETCARFCLPVTGGQGNSYPQV